MFVVVDDTGAVVKATQPLSNSMPSVRADLVEKHPAIKFNFIELYLGRLDSHFSPEQVKAINKLLTKQ